MKKDFKSVKETIINYVTNNSWFDIDENDEDTLLFSTRENGNVGNETFGQKDYKKALELSVHLETIKEITDCVNICVSDCDEFVMIEIVPIED